MPDMKFIDLKDIISLKKGDIVKHKYNHTSYVVTANYGGRATAVDTIDITNPPEWQVLKVTKEKE